MFHTYGLTMGRIATKLKARYLLFGSFCNGVPNISAVLRLLYQPLYSAYSVRVANNLTGYGLLAAVGLKPLLVYSSYYVPAIRLVRFGGEARRGLL